MYRVMLVEDDEVIRYVYSRMKAWEKSGFQIVAEAGNGLQAMDEMKKKSGGCYFYGYSYAIYGWDNVDEENAGRVSGHTFCFCQFL